MRRLKQHVRVSNEFETVLQVERVTDELFVATTDVGTDCAWSVEVVLNSDGEIDIAAGVPDVEYEELLEEFEMRDTGQLAFEYLAANPCSEFERALLLFLVLEWFYFG